MLFNSIEFAWFFNFFALVYFILPRKFRPLALLAASYYFYMAWNAVFILLLIASTTVDYFAAQMITKSKQQNVRRFFLLLSICANLSLLVFFKYYDFLSENLTILFETMNIPVHIPEWNFLLPVGISFYTFQTMSYTVDVYKKRIPAEQSFVIFALYVAFFPQLIAGPIERAKQLIPQLKNPQPFNLQRSGEGLVLILWGLFLKVIIADSLAVFIDDTLQVPIHSGELIWAAMYGFAIQLYCDFAGYSIIAIGVAQILGIRLMANFNAPYLARNIADFWNRWHISLSSWFRDYLFQPFYKMLGKKITPLTGSFLVSHNICFFLSCLLTTVLLGFWHGADWGFGIFGLIHALLISSFHFNKRLWEKMPDWIQLAVTFQLFVFTCIFFRMRSLTDIHNYFSRIPDRPDLVLISVLISVILLILADKLYTDDLRSLLKRFRQSSYVHYGAFFVWLYGSILLLFVGSEYLSKPRQFIYFQF